MRIFSPKPGLSRQSGRRSKWQVDREATTSTDNAFDRDGAAVREDDGARDGESEAGSSRVAGPSRIEPDERLEDPVDVRRIDSDARIANKNAHRSAFAQESNHDFAARGRVLHGVV